MELVLDQNIDIVPENVEFDKLWIFSYNFFQIRLDFAPINDIETLTYL